MQYCSLQHWTLLPSPVTSATGCCFSFASASSFFPELFLYSSPVANWAPTNLGSSSFSVISFFPFHTVHGFLKARILKWFAISFSNGPRFARTLCYDLSFNFMVAVTICSDFGTQENKVFHCFHCLPIYLT